METERQNGSSSHRRPALKRVGKTFIHVAGIKFSTLKTSELVLKRCSCLICAISLWPGFLRRPLEVEEIIVLLAWIDPLWSLLSRSTQAGFLWKLPFCCSAQAKRNFHCYATNENGTRPNRALQKRIEPADAATRGWRCWTRTEEKPDVRGRHALGKCHWLLLRPSLVSCRLPTLVRWPFLCTFLKTF